MKKAARLFVCALFPILMESSLGADNYPIKPIKMIVAWPAGGTADQRSRQIMEKLTNALGQPVK